MERTSGLAAALNELKSAQDTLAGTNLSTEVYNATVDEYHRALGIVRRGFEAKSSHEIVFAHGKLKVLQQWINESRDMKNLNVGAFDLKFS